MRRYRPHLLVLGVLAMVLIAGLHAPLQNAMTALRFGWMPRQASGQVVVVAIDSRSIERIGVWPWPRTIYATLIDRLEAARAGEIVFDIDLSSASTADADRALEDALARAGGSVILPAFKQFTRTHGGALTVHVDRPLPQFARRSWTAAINVEADPDGLVRRYPFGEMLGDTFVPSVGALLAGRYEPRPPMLIDFGIRTASVPTLSYVDVLRGDPAALRAIAGKKVIVGATALELGDRINVPTGQVLPGVMLQAIAAESILQDRALGSVPAIATVGALGVLILLMTVFWRRRSTRARVALLLGFGLAIELTAFLLQARLPVVLDTSLVQVAILVYLIAIAVDEIDLRGMLARIGESRFQRIAMSIGDGLVCVNGSGTITVWNAGATAIFGYEADEMIGRSFAPLIVATRGAPGPFAIAELAPDALQASGRKLIELAGRRKNGEVFSLEACFSTWQETDGVVYGVVLRDISQRKREAERIWQLATYDPLTGLSNRNTLYEHLEETFALARSAGAGATVALMLLDLDKFKDINDSLGHACGDDVLKEAASRLTRMVGEEGLVARLGGDEFAIVLAGSDAEAAAEKLSVAISNSFREGAFIIRAHRFNLGCSIGVALFPRDCDDVQGILANADLAMYRAKSAGSGRSAVYTPAIRSDLEQRLLLTHELERAAENGEFELFYQPQVRLKDWQVVGAEALLRWRHPTRGLTLPGEFLPVLHGTSAVDPIARWVLETACRQGRLWHRRGNGIRLSVNLFPAQFEAGDLAGTIAKVLADTGLPPQLLELEVTENILLDDDERAREAFRRIGDLGAHIALDDFGTGYASLSYLKKFPLNRLKIDQSFVRELEPGTPDAAIVESTIALSKLLGLSVTAEGIEQHATFELLKTMGCTEGQGFYFGHPMPAEEFERTFLAAAAAPFSARRGAASAA